MRSIDIDLFRDSGKLLLNDTTYQIATALLRQTTILRRNSKARAAFPTAS